MTRVLTAFITEKPTRTVAHQIPAAVSPAFVLDMVRNAFGLNVSDTAEVFQITRQTAYQWMKLSAMEQVRSHADRERIKVLYRAAQFWNEQPMLKGRWLRAILPTGVTVLDILKANTIDLDTLKAAYATLSGSSAQRRQDEGERAAKAATSLANAFAGSASSATGGRSASSATGYSSASSATGDRSASSATGYSSASSATGYSSASSATGDMSASSATGDMSASLTTGFESHSEILPYPDGNPMNAIAIAAGGDSWARAPEGCAIVLCYRDHDGKIIHVRASKVGENGVKPNVWYSLDENGEFVECAG